MNPNFTAYAVVRLELDGIDKIIEVHLDEFEAHMWADNYGKSIKTSAYAVVPVICTRVSSCKP
jgi:hypothetical protein